MSVLVPAMSPVTTWSHRWVGGFLVVLLGPLMTSAMTCNVTVALGCRSSGLSDGLEAPPGNVTETMILTACSATAREDKCFNDYTGNCDSNTKASALAQWEGSVSTNRRLCAEECSSYQGVVQCVQQASTVAPSESHHLFCRNFENGLACSTNFTSSCNVSRHLFEALVGAFYLQQFFAYCHSDEYVEHSEGCRPDQAASCLAQLRYQVDSFLSSYRNDSHHPQQLLQACSIALEEDNTTECYHMVMNECANSSSPQLAQLMYEDLLNETTQICEEECSGFQGIKTCLSGMTLDAMETDLVTFCRSYSQGLECAEAAAPGCNMSTALLNSIAGERAAHIYGVFCLQGGATVPVSDTCNPPESERCFMALQDNFDSFLSSYVIANHTRLEVSHICTTVTQGNQMTQCFRHSTQTCSSPDMNPVTVQFQMLMEDIHHICLTECPGLDGVHACTNLADFSLLKCQDACSDYKPFCRSIEGARQCLGQLNCTVAEDILDEIMPAEAKQAEAAHCRGESCFSDTLLTQLDPSSGTNLNRDICSQFLQAFSCVLRECGQRGLSNCISRLDPPIQHAISASLPPCEKLLGKPHTGGAPMLTDRSIHLLAVATSAVLLFLQY